MTAVTIDNHINEAYPVDSVWQLIHTSDLEVINYTMNDYRNYTLYCNDGRGQSYTIENLLSLNKHCHCKIHKLQTIGLANSKTKIYVRRFN